MARAWDVPRHVFEEAFPACGYKKGEVNRTERLLRLLLQAPKGETTQTACVFLNKWARSATKPLMAQRKVL